MKLCLDKECNKNNIKHRGKYLIGILVVPYTTATNGMADRVNETIKNTIIKAVVYTNIEDIKKYLDKF